MDQDDPSNAFTDMPPLMDDDLDGNLDNKDERNQEYHDGGVSNNIHEEEDVDEDRAQDTMLT